MNFKIVEKLMEERVTEALKQHVEQSDGTRIFLKLIRYVVSSYMDYKLSVLERIFRIWYAVFFVRFWHKWLLDSNLSVEDFFITPNSLFCIELNAHEMIKIIIYCRQNNCPEIFIPQFFNSQWNESFFRKLRSMSSTFSTVVNFSVLQSLYRVKRVDFLLESEILLSLDSSVKSRDYYVPKEMPTDLEVMDMIEAAKFDAMTDLNAVGIQCNSSATCTIQPAACRRTTNFEEVFHSVPDINAEVIHEVSIENESIIDMKDLFPGIQTDIEVKDCSCEYGKCRRY